jgi:16S rRNA (guanine527-N7)-methyltransferase
MHQPLTARTIEQAVAAAGLNPLADGIAAKFALFAELLQHWNSRLNLTALRTPEQILDRHFIECIFCAQHLPEQYLPDSGSTLLDFGSGAGFPGIPIALCRPDISVTLGESSGKKAAFLREALRTLELKAEVYSGRIEDMAARDFNMVTMRAVDKMAEALSAAVTRVRQDGVLILLTSNGLELSADKMGLHLQSSISLPESESRMLLQYRKV